MGSVPVTSSRQLDSIQPLGFCAVDLPAARPQIGNAHFRSCDDLPASVTPSCKRKPGGAGIFTCCPSTTPFGLALGTDSPWADLPSPGNLRLTAKKILTSLIATHTCMITSTSSRARYRTPSTYRGTLPYRSRPPKRTKARGFGSELSPADYRRRNARPVSYYALFK